MKRSPTGFRCEASACRHELRCLHPFGLFFYGDPDKPISVISLRYPTGGFGLSYERHSLQPSELVLYGDFGKPTSTSGFRQPSPAM